jgi:hypothetical protein
MKEMPDDLRDLERKLRSVRFRPRASFGPELLGRLRRGDQPSGSGRRELSRHLATAAAAVLTAGGALLFANFASLIHANAVTVDRCCYDLDGGGVADDGVLIAAERNARVHRLRVYEDLDSSGSYTPGDLVRLDRQGDPAMHQPGAAGLVTREHCCVDLDGGGPDDDALLVIGVPPDRVMMAAIYETGAAAGSRSSRPAGWPLR